MSGMWMCKRCYFWKIVKLVYFVLLKIIGLKMCILMIIDGLFGGGVEKMVFIFFSGLIEMGY